MMSTDSESTGRTCADSVLVLRTEDNSNIPAIYKSDAFWSEMKSEDDIIILTCLQLWRKENATKDDRKTA
jgi:hypothetical protein